MTKFRFAAAPLAGLILASPALAGGYTYTTLPYSAGVVVGALGDNGQVAGFIHQGPASAGYDLHLIWTPEPKKHDFVARVPMYVDAISAKGVAVGFQVRKNGIQGYEVAVTYDTNSGRLHQLPVSDPYGGEGATGINTSGTIIGNESDPSAHGLGAGFVYQAGKVSYFREPKASYTQLNAINDAGVIVGEAGTSTQGPYAFILNNGSYTNITPPDAMTAFATFITHSNIAGGRFMDNSGSTHGFTFDGTGFTIVTYPGSTYTRVLGVGPSGEIFGDATVGNSTAAFVDINNQFSLLSVPGSVQTSVATSNKAGTLAGTYTDQKGVVHGFRAVCAPAAQPCTH